LRRISSLDVDFLRVLGGCSKPKNLDRCSLFVEELDSFLSNDQSFVGGFFDTAKAVACSACQIANKLNKDVGQICQSVCNLIGK